MVGADQRVYCGGSRVHHLEETKKPPWVIAAFFGHERRWLVRRAQPENQMAGHVRPAIRYKSDGNPLCRSDVVARLVRCLSDSMHNYRNKEHDAGE
jgi:hypothetical protein